MSVLTHKCILVVGEENAQILHLEDVLCGHGAEIERSTCEQVTPELVKEHFVDLILLNYLSEATYCKDMFNALRSSDPKTIVPIFVVVEEDNKVIEDVLSFGAADYITAGEDVQSITHKMKAVFSEAGAVSPGAIDISPIEAAITTTGIRVYVIEDDPLLRNLLSIRLNKSSFPYEFSDDGDQAVTAMNQFNPQVIILDLMLPGKSGFELLAEIKADENLKDVPVIVFSNRDGQEDRQRADELGAAAFYVKAMTDLSELIETIESLVKK